MSRHNVLLISFCLLISVTIGQLVQYEEWCPSVPIVTVTVIDCGDGILETLAPLPASISSSQEADEKDLGTIAEDEGSENTYDLGSPDGSSESNDGSGGVDSGFKSDPGIAFGSPSSSGTVQISLAASTSPISSQPTSPTSQSSIASIKLSTSNDSSNSSTSSKFSSGITSSRHSTVSGPSSGSTRPFSSIISGSSNSQRSSRLRSIGSSAPSRIIPRSSASATSASSNPSGTVRSSASLYSRQSGTTPSSRSPVASVPASTGRSSRSVRSSDSGSSRVTYLSSGHSLRPSSTRSASISRSSTLPVVKTCDTFDGTCQVSCGNGQIPIRTPDCIASVVSTQCSSGRADDTKVPLVLHWGCSTSNLRCRRRDLSGRMWQRTDACDCLRL